MSSSLGLERIPSTQEERLQRRRTIESELSIAEEESLSSALPEGFKYENENEKPPKSKHVIFVKTQK